MFNRLRNWFGGVNNKVHNAQDQARSVFDYDTRADAEFEEVLEDDRHDVYVGEKPGTIILAHGDLQVEIPTETYQELHALVYEDQKVVSAIKALREATGLSLVEAKYLIDHCFL